MFQSSPVLVFKQNSKRPSLRFVPLEINSQRMKMAIALLFIYLVYTSFATTNENMSSPQLSSSENVSTQQGGQTPFDHTVPMTEPSEFNQKPTISTRGVSILKPVNDASKISHDASGPLIAISLSAVTDVMEASAKQMSSSSNQQSLNHTIGRNNPPGV